MPTKVDLTQFGWEERRIEAAGGGYGQTVEIYRRSLPAGLLAVAVET
jgi:hypothetical protein